LSTIMLSEDGLFPAGTLTWGQGAVPKW